MLACDRSKDLKLLIRLPRGCTLRVTGLEAMAEYVGVSMGGVLEAVFLCWG